MENYQSTYLFGKRFPNRLFVGGLPLNTTGQELGDFFANFSNVLEAKVIVDEDNVSKGYGFVSFQNASDVKNVTNMGTLFLRNKKLNLGPAVKKQIQGPVDNPELVVVNSQMRGEYYYPLQVQAPNMVQQVPVIPCEPYVPQGMVYNHYAQFPYGYTSVYGHAHQTATPESHLLSQPGLYDPVPSSTHMPIRHQQRRMQAPRFRTKQRAN